MFAKADLHVHSKYSERPSEWFLQRLGANESYVDPEHVYLEAKRKGMTFVTLTDHNRIDGALLLQAKHPEDVFLGMECTTYFPEDNCKIHVLVFGLDEKQYTVIQECRQNIYVFRDYLKKENLAYSVAHATFSENGKLTLMHLEKLILLFDVFEGINGTRNRMHNQGWTDVLMKITPAQISALQRKHGIEPISDTPWVKSFTGGSDDHSGLYIAKAHTIAQAGTVGEFLDQLRQKRTRFAGRHNDYKSFAFALYKIAYDFSKTKTDGKSSAVFKMLHDLVFDKKQPGIKNKMVLKALKRGKKKQADMPRYLLAELISGLRADISSDAEKKLDMVYNKLSEISDEFFKMLLHSLERDLREGNLSNLIMSLSACLPGVFLSLPFFNTLKHMYQDRALIDRLTQAFGTAQDTRRKRILWFTDTLADLNGVSSTLTSVGWLTHNSTLELKIATTLTEQETSKNLPPNTMILPCLHHYQPTDYKDYTLKVPSVLKSLELTHDFEPDLILISTPGPVGWIGLLAAKLLNVRHVGVYHTDFSGFAKRLIKDDGITELVENCSRWFYSLMHEIRVPSQAYLSVLEQRGYAREKMKLFPRGIDSQKFSPKTSRMNYCRQKYWKQEGFNLLYVGRISKEKNLDFLAETYLKLVEQFPDMNLTVVGNGPYLEEFQIKFQHLPRVLFTGQLSYEELPYVYSSADALLFPSTCDTFGMVVLEAQACGLPALVSDQGGPQEIIIDGKTGWALPVTQPNEWIQHIMELEHLKTQQPDDFMAIRRLSRQHVVSRYDWATAFQDLFALQKSNTLVFKESALQEKKSSLLETSLILD